MEFWTQIRILLSAFVLPGVFGPSAYGSELLRFDFNDSADLGIQTGALPAGMVSGDAKPSRVYPGSVEFGPAGGLINVPSFHGPKGPFSVEARFLVHNYGTENGRFI